VHWVVVGIAVKGADDIITAVLVIVDVYWVVAAIAVGAIDDIINAVHVIVDVCWVSVVISAVLTTKDNYL
jgi:hypothetical protein